MWKQWQILFSWAPKSLWTVTASMKLRHLFFGRKATTDIDNVLKSNSTILVTKVCVAKGMVFPVVMYGCESWTIKKAEHWKIDAFELWCWRRLLRVPWNVRRSNKSILKEIILEYSLEGLMLKLKHQYFGHQKGRADSLEKILMLGKIEGKRRRKQQKMWWLDDISDSKDMSWNQLLEIVKDREAWHAAVHEVTKSQTGPSDWITTTKSNWVTDLHWFFPLIFIYTVSGFSELLYYFNENKKYPYLKVESTHQELRR